MAAGGADAGGAVGAGGATATPQAALFAPSPVVFAVTKAHQPENEELVAVLQGMGVTRLIYRRATLAAAALQRLQCDGGVREYG